MTMPIFAQPVSVPAPSSAANSSNGARLVASDGRALPLERTSLVSDAGGGIARSVLQQVFRNDGDVPLEVTYLLPLPHDGAVSGYSFTLCGATTRGHVEPLALARERYEEALLEGKSAALLEQDRGSVFRQAIGNIPPGERIEIEVSVDHPLTWLDGGWELRFPTVVAPRYQSGRETSATVAVALPAEGQAMPTHQVRVSIADNVLGVPRSPSHSIAIEYAEPVCASVSNAQLDRDLVIRWQVAEQSVGARLETARLAAQNPRVAAQFGLLTLVPPSVDAKAMSRDLIVLLDTSGSMSGEPLAQAVRIVSALVQSLNEHDSLELIEFGSRPRRWREGAAPVTPENERAALTWLAALRAGGGTEMRSGIEAALATLRAGALRQVILVSDGLIGFEQEVLERLMTKLPESCRFHSIGVGHATNGSLLQPAARAGRGACIVVAPGEDVEAPCARLLARTARPLVVNLRISGTALAEAAQRPLDLYSGAPALLPLALKAEGGTLEILGETPDGSFVRRLEVEPRAAGSGNARITALYARNQVEDLELLFAAKPGERERVNVRIEQLGVDFQIATRLTSWVAVDDVVRVDGSRGSRRVEQPQTLPAGLSAEGLGLHAPRSMAFAVAGFAPPSPASPELLKMRRVMAPVASTPAGAGADAPARSRGLLQRVRGFFAGGGSLEQAPPPSETLRGLIRINNEKRFAIAIATSNELRWALPARVKLELADGSSLVLEVEQKHSTQSGTIAAGLEIRLVCRLLQKLPAEAVRMTIELEHEQRWIVELAS
ncbi:MAG: VIT domain-containing protein [Polyangiaceae bacterium]